MYEAFYGFREKPFNLTPDPKFLYLSGKHNEAFAHLEFGLTQRGGFMAVTGDTKGPAQDTGVPGEGTPPELMGEDDHTSLARPAFG